MGRLFGDYRILIGHEGPVQDKYSAGVLEAFSDYDFDLDLGTVNEFTGRLARAGTSGPTVSGTGYDGKPLKDNVTDSEDER